MAKNTALYVIRREHFIAKHTFVTQTLGKDGNWYIATNDALKLPLKDAKKYKAPGVFTERCKRV